jgi:hypothetical protein
LEEDLSRHFAILARIGQDPKQERERKSILAHLEHARVKDPDLKSLRGTPEFEALFKAQQ